MGRVGGALEDTDTDIVTDFTGDIIMGSGMDIIMECVQVIVQVTVQGGLQHQEMYTGTGPVESAQRD